MDQKLVEKIDKCMELSKDLTVAFMEEIDGEYKHSSDDSEFEFYMHGLQKILLSVLARNDYKERLKLR